MQNFNVVNFMAALQAITITGVESIATSPPYTLGTAKLPIGFARFPATTTELDSLSLGGCTSLTNLTVEFVIVISPVRQGNSLTNWNEGLALVDALNTAFANNLIELNIDDWTVELTVEEFGQTPYHVLLTTINASG